MLGVWRPWTAAFSTKTISITGDATIKALPDEFVFNPAYEKKAETEKEALAAVNAVTAEVIKGLKGLGVADKDIATSSNAGSGYYPFRWDDTTKTGHAQVTITIHDKNLATQVQDYLLTTNLTGSASPQSSFSESRRKDLEAQARTKAIADAKSKADQAASELGLRVGKAQSINLSGGYGGTIPMMANDSSAGGKPMIAKSEVAPVPSQVYTGQNEISASVSIVYALR